MNQSIVFASRMYLVGALLLTLFCLDLFGQATDRKATVKFVIGDVTVRKGEAGAWRPLRVGAKLVSKDMVRTQVESRVELQMEDGTTLNFEENSVVGLDKLLADGGGTNTKVSIKTGSVAFSVKKLTSKKSDFVFETPTATAAIRGTEGGIGVKGKATYAFLKEGKLDLAPKGGGKGVTIIEKQVALQSPSGFSVQKVSNQEALEKAVSTVQKLMEDTTKMAALAEGGDLNKMMEETAAAIDSVQNNPSDTAKGDANSPKSDSTKLDSSSQAPAQPTDTVAAATPADSAALAKQSPLPNINTNTEADTANNKNLPSPITPTVTPTVTPTPTPPTDPLAITNSAKPDEALFVRIESPSEGSDVTTALLSVSGSTLPTAKVSAQGQQAVADAGGKFRFALKAPAAAGSYKVEVVAELNGKRTSQSVGFKVPQADLVLSVESPSEGSEVATPTLTVKGRATPGAEVQVFEVKTKTDATGAWSAVIQSPKEAGQYKVAVKASFGSQNVAQDVSIVRVLPKVAISGRVNPLPSSIDKPEVNLSGVCNDGAIIKVGSFSAVARGGAWQLKVTWPANQEGLISFPVFCSFNNEEQQIGEVSTDYRKPIIPLVLNLATPTSLKQSAAELEVRGTVTGQSPKVEINGSGALVVGNNFSGKIRFSEQNWDLKEIVVRAYDNNGDQVKTISLDVNKKSRMINTKAPRWVGEPSLSTDNIRYSLSDNQGDEGVVKHLVDGETVEEKTWQGSLAGQRLLLKSGKHDYKLEAKDLAGNSVVWQRLAVEFYPRAEWTISMIEPRSNVTKRIPPAPGQADWQPKTDVRFRINSLPDDDYHYLKQITIRNESNGYSQVLRDLQIDDVEFSFEVPLQRQSTNTLRVVVEPKTGPIREEVRLFTLR